MEIESGEQSRNMIARFAHDTEWRAVKDAPLQNVIDLPQEEFGRRAADWINNGCQLVVKGPGVLVVDRSKPFDPNRFMLFAARKEWSTWLGPPDGYGLEGEEDQDPRSVILTEINFLEVEFEHFLAKRGEGGISGEEKIRRMKKDPRIRYDAGVGHALLDEPGQITLRLIHEMRGITEIEFATVLRDFHHQQFLLSLFRHGNGTWHGRGKWLGETRRREHVSPVSKS